MPTTVKGGAIKFDAPVNTVDGAFSKITIVDHSNETRLQKFCNDLSLWWRGVATVWRLNRLSRINKEGGGVGQSHDLRSGIR